MSESAQEQAISRRTLFRRVSGGLGVAGAAMAISGRRAEPRAPRSDRDGGYRRTEHVDKVYEAASF